jgi:hypothetical protein
MIWSTYSEGETPTPIHLSHSLYRFDALTQEEILPPYESKTQVHKALKMRFGTLLSLIEAKTPQKRIIYSTERKFPEESV